MFENVTLPVIYEKEFLRLNPLGRKWLTVGNVALALILKKQKLIRILICFILKSRKQENLLRIF